MNEWIVVIAALLVASVPWLLLEVFDRARQQELRALAGKHVPQIHHRTRLQRATAAACAAVGLAAVAAATGLVALPTHVVVFSVAFLTLGVTTPVAWMGMAAASRDVYRHVSAALEDEPPMRTASLTQRRVSDAVSVPAQLVPFVVSFAGIAIVAVGALQGWSGFTRPMLPIVSGAIGLSFCGLYRAWMGAEARAAELPEHLRASGDGLTRSARIRRVFVAQLWLAILYTVIGSALAATDWSDPVGKASGGFLLLGSGVVGLWASARALTSEHGIPAAAGVVRQRGAITPTE